MKNLSCLALPGCVVAAAASTIAGWAAPTAAQSSTTRQTTNAPSAFLVAPSEGRAIGLETRWLAHSSPSPGARATEVFACDGDSVFVADSTCHITRIVADSGTAVWSTACGRMTDRVLDIDRATFMARLPDGRNGELAPPAQLDEVLVTLDAGIVSFDAHTGHLAQTQRLERIPSTRSLHHDKYLIFGARGGQLVWQQFAVGCMWKCNELGGSILAAPIRMGDSIAAASSAGVVLAVDPDTTRQVWRRRVAGGVTGRLATGDDALFAASADQSIHAFEASTGKTRWRHLAATPLACDLFCDGSRVYAQIPGSGLTALATHTETLLETRVLWTAPVAGNAIARAGNRVLVWDAASHTLTAVDAESGHVEGRAVIPDAVDLEVADAVNCRLYLLGADGTLQLLQAADKQAVAAE